MNGGALSPSLANQDWVWNDVAFISTELGASVPYVMENLPELTRATLIYQDDVVGQDAVDIVGSAWEGEGRTLDTLPVAVNATSFTAQVDKVRAQDPDVIFLVYSGDSQATLIQQLRSSGVDAQVVGASPLQVPSVVGLKEADGSLFTLQGMDLASSDEITRFFLEELDVKPGAGAPVNEANYCNGVLMWAEAARQLIEDDEDVDGAGINERFEDLGAIDAVGGPLELLPDHTLKSDIAINRIKDGRVTTLATVPAGD
jgi:branched-chain amino acid transport system substrate-binding protein